MSETLTDISTNSKQISQRISKAATQSGRTPQEITLVAVTKRQSDERIEALWQTGQRVFGENQVTEAEAHWQGRRLQSEPFRLHFIGHLQSNKAVRAVALFDVIETIDSIKLAKAVDKAVLKTGRQPKLLIQVNTGEESQKSGILPEALPRFLEQIKSQTGLNVEGLMCIPPQGDESGLHFALLSKLAAEHGLSTISMGMSDDFETAIQFGATSIRVGSALLGTRGD